MSFFNKKEDVIDIELTQFGKYLLSKGRFKPAFYTFSDDEILYNNAYVDPNKFNETGKKTSQRIQKETQRLKTLYEHEGVETRILKLNQHKTNEQGTSLIHRDMPFEDMYGSDHLLEEQMGKDDRNIVRNYIGNSSFGVEEVPSWDVEELFQGKITDIIVSSSGPNIGLKRPVLEFEIEHSLDVYKMPNEHPNYNITPTQFNRAYNGLERQFSFVDDLNVEIDEGVMILSVIEDNVDYDLENFEIEFYEVIRAPNFNNADGKATEEELTKLYTTERFFSDNANKVPITSEYIDYYFDIMTDQDLAEHFGFDLRSANRDRLRAQFSKVISDYYARIEQLEGFGDLAVFADGEVINRIPRTLGSMSNTGAVGALDGLGDDADTTPTGGPSSRDNENTPVNLGDEEDICDD